MSQPDDKYYTPVMMELKEMAEQSWVDFCKLIGEEAILAAIVCKLRARGHSMQMISNSQQLTKRRVQKICERKCYCDYPYIMRSAKQDIAATVTKSVTTSSETAKSVT